jgi:ABC-2 type transport system ATP-binding protein
MDEVKGDDSLEEVFLDLEGVPADDADHRSVDHSVEAVPAGSTKDCAQ